MILDDELDANDHRRINQEKKKRKTPPPQKKWDGYDLDDPHEDGSKGRARRQVLQRTDSTAVTQIMHVVQTQNWSGRL